jgi:predicted nucleic acid-binding protein
MAPVLLDTSGLYEAADRRAPRHAACRDVFRELLSRPAGLLTTEDLLAETHALVVSRVGPEPARTLLERLTASPRIEVVPVDAGSRGAALSFFVIGRMALTRWRTRSRSWSCGSGAWAPS